MPQLHLGAAKLEADSVDFWIDVLGLLDELDRFLEFPQAHVRATSDVTGRRGIGVHAQYLLRELDGAVALVREQTGVGKIQQRVGMSRLKRNRFLKRFNRLGCFALFVITLARIHQTGELVAARRRLPPQPEAKKQRCQNDGWHHDKVNRQTSLCLVGFTGLHDGEVSAGVEARKANDSKSETQITNNKRNPKSKSPKGSPPIGIELFVILSTFAI